MIDKGSWGNTASSFQQPTGKVSITHSMDLHKSLPGALQEPSRYQGVSAAESVDQVLNVTATSLCARHFTETLDTVVSHLHSFGFELQEKQ